MKLYNVLRFDISCIGLLLGYYLGELNGLLIALLIFMIVDYITGVICAIVDKKLSSAIGFKGICKKVLILLIVGIANILDTKIIGAGSAMRTAVILFYISNEGISIIENSAKIGVPIPQKIIEVLAQLKESE